MLWGEQGAEATPRLLRGGQTPRLCSLGGQRGSPPRPRACFQPLKEAKFAPDYPSSGVKLTVSGGFAHATGACLLPELNLAPAFAFGEEKIAGGCAGEGKEKGQRQEASPSLPPAPLSDPL